MNKDFTSGEIYTLKQLFTISTNGKIVIPDLQRDYCWGNIEPLVSDFVKSIKEQYKEKPNDPLMMGLLYGYYEDERPYIQLCDGQQRLTTLFLLLGLINRKCDEEPFKNILISDYELEEDDKEPKLLYSIRDSSLYFLSDLVCNFFLTKDESNPDQKVSEYIRGCNWWFASYDNDPTIQNMLAALDVINSQLDFDKEKLMDLGNYISEHLQFIFYDMVTRQNGEETFVIINTTGEPLTATENLKPLVVTKNSQNEGDNGKKWEEIDNWFWTKRDKDNYETSDAGMKEFLRWVAGIYGPKDDKNKYYSILTEDNYLFPYNDIYIDKIYKVYEALKCISEDESLLKSCELLSVPLGKRYDLKEYFVILPSLRYFLKFNYKDGIKSVYRFFYNLQRYTEISQANNNVLLALDSIEQMPDFNLYSMLNINNINRTYILTDEERIKLQILENHLNIREDLEDEFEKMASHDVLSGRINCLIDWSGGINNFKFDDFKEYAEKFDEIFKRNSYNVTSDTLVMAFATIGLSDYPIPIGSPLLFGVTSKDWNNIIYKSKEDNIKKMGYFFKRIVKVEKPIEEIAETIIKEWGNDEENKNNILYPLITGFSIPSKEFEKYGMSWERRIILHPSGLIRVLCGANRNYRDFYLLGDTILPCYDKENDKGWNTVWFWEDNNNHCLVMDHSEYDITFDLRFSTTIKDNWSLRIFERGNERKKFSKLNEITIDLHDDGNGKTSKEMPISDLLELIKKKKEKIRELTVNMD